MSDFEKIVLPKIVETVKTLLNWGVDELTSMFSSSTKEEQEDNTEADITESDD